MTRASGIVVSHGHGGELERLVPVLAPQLDELVVIANRPGSAPGVLPSGVRVVENARPRRLAENVNLGTAATSGDWVVFANPDVLPEADAVGSLVAFGETRERCGLAGPRTVWPDGRWQPTRRRFPTVSGTIVRRTPLRRLRPPLEQQRDRLVAAGLERAQAFSWEAAAEATVRTYAEVLGR